MMTVGSVGYLGSAPATAVFGLASVFLYVFPAFVFLIPVSLVAAELASGWEAASTTGCEKGSPLRWVCVAVWCQFAQTIFYYPALLAFVGEHARVRHRPDLWPATGSTHGASSSWLFWLSVLVTSRGVDARGQLSSSGTVIGTLIPGALLVGVGVVYLSRATIRGADERCSTSCRRGAGWPASS